MAPITPMRLYPQGVLKGLLGIAVLSALVVARAVVDNMLLQKFIEKRSRYYWIMHFLLAWGCIGAVSPALR